MSKPVLVYPPVPLTVRAQPTHLGSDPRGNELLLYCVSNAVVVRDLADPSKTYLYQEHKQAPTVARLSPSGFYIASGDQYGYVRIWDATQPEHILKNEYHLLAGPIMDIDWSADNTKLAVSGQGKEKFAVVISMDTGTNVGEVSGHSKTISAVSLRPCRPFRLMTASEDTMVNFYEGPPFRFKNSFRRHEGFVNCVRYEPGGSLVASASSDKRIMCYNGDTGEYVAETRAPAHTTGVMAVAWSRADLLVSASTDKTIRTWEAPSLAPVAVEKMGADLEDQQLGLVRLGEDVVSISLRGFMQRLRVRPKPEASISRVGAPLRGHNRRITALGADASSALIISADFSGRLLLWTFGSPNETSLLEGKGHATQITQLAVVAGRIITVSMDDTLIVSSIADRRWGTPLKLGVQPLGVAASADLSVIAVIGSDVLLIIGRDGQIAARVPLNFGALSVAVSPSGSNIAVGGADYKIRHYRVPKSSSPTAELATTAEDLHRGEVRVLAFGASGNLVSGDSNREIVVSDSQGGRIKTGWVTHTTSINGVAWSPDEKHIASVATDANLIVWNVQTGAPRVFKNAHQGGGTVVAWYDNQTIVSGGQDCAIKSWKI